MKLSPRIALIATAVALLLGIIVLAVVLVVPQFGRLGELESQIQSADDSVDQAQALLAVRQEAKTNAAATDAGLIELSAAVPETPDLPSFIIEMQDVAYDSNVVLRSIQPEEIVPNTGFVTVPVRVTVWGAWADCVDFVQRTQKLTRQVRVYEVNVGVVDQSDRELAVAELPPYSTEVQVLYYTYVIPPASETTGTAAPAAPAPAQ